MKLNIKNNVKKNKHHLYTCIFGHVMRSDGLENILTTGKIEGGRNRGRMSDKILTV
jgi:hypothetical protein